MVKTLSKEELMFSDEPMTSKIHISSCPYCKFIKDIDDCAYYMCRTINGGKLIVRFDANAHSEEYNFNEINNSNFTGLPDFKVALRAYESSEAEEQGLKQCADSICETVDSFVLSELKEFNKFTVNRCYVPGYTKDWKKKSLFRKKFRNFIMQRKSKS
jgi:glutaredoxin